MNDDGAQGVSPFLETETPLAPLRDKIRDDELAEAALGSSGATVEVFVELDVPRPRIDMRRGWSGTTTSVRIEPATSDPSDDDARLRRVRALLERAGATVHAWIPAALAFTVEIVAARLPEIAASDDVRSIVPIRERRSET